MPARCEPATADNVFAGRRPESLSTRGIRGFTHDRRMKDEDLARVPTGHAERRRRYRDNFRKLPSPPRKRCTRRGEPRPSRSHPPRLAGRERCLRSRTRSRVIAWKTSSIRYASIYTVVRCSNSRSSTSLVTPSESARAKWFHSTIAPNNRPGFSMG